MNAVVEREQLTFDVGGREPDGASLRITGGRVEIAGQYEKGQKLRVSMLVEVREVAFVDEVDQKTGQVVGTERRHKAAVVGAPAVETAEDE